MTTFGIDVSRFQAGIDLRSLDVAVVTFVAAKVSEGMGWKDPQFETYRRQAEESDLLFAAYHCLRGDYAPGDQVRNVQEVLAGSGIPVILDIERTNGVPQPTMADARAFRTIAQDQGLRVSNLLYLPEWYWAEIQHPSTAGWDLWQSDYGPNDGKYPGDSSNRWTAMGRQASVLQFTSQGRIPGYSGNLYINAFRGTREELASKGWFHDYKENTVATKAEIQTWVATAPIVVDPETGKTQPLQQVLRRLLTTTPSGGPSASEIAAAVVAAIPPDVDLTRADVKNAVESVFRERFSS
jgi:lysozyme